MEIRVARDGQDEARALVEQRAQSAELRLVRFLYCDYGSIVRGKATHAAHLGQRLREGIALVQGQLAMNALDDLQPVPGMTAVGEVRLAPDPESFVILPYAPRTGSMMCDLYTLDRQLWAACPRGFLRRMLDRAADAGMRVEAAFEHEFYLVRPDETGTLVPFDQSLCFSTTGMDSTAQYVDELLQALELQGIQPEQALPEYGPGQQEISVRHDHALRAADNQIRVRETAKAIARRHGAIASFAAKPFAEEIGSGAHLHLSLWSVEGSDNLLYDQSGSPYGLSELGRHFIGGVLAHLPGLTAITCPTVNSFRRLQPHAWASAFICYGFDNREAAVRVPSSFWGREQGTTNIELKAVDNTCNPYLALGALVAAGLDGITRKLDPGPPVDRDPGLFSERELNERGLRRLPGSIDEALDALAADATLTEAMGETMANAFLTVRRSEADAFRDQPDAFEFAEHMAKY